MKRFYSVLSAIDGKLDEFDLWMHQHVIDRCPWVVIYALLLIVLVGCAVIYVDHVNENNADYDIAYYLNQSGWELYTASRCSYCDTQKDIIGSLEGLVVYECDSKTDNSACLSAGIDVVPMWINVNTGERIEGMQNMAQLEGMIV